MRTHIALYAYAALVSLAIVGPSDAQTVERSYDTSMLPVMEFAEPGDAFSGTAYPRTGAAESLPRRTRSVNARLTEIAAWLSANFDLPAIQDQPRVEFASPMKLASMRYHGILPDQWREDSMSGAPMQAHEVVAVYHDATRTIFLSDGWTGASPAELSVLVHEMVHHLQNLAGLRYECPAAREKLAYLAQDQWLKLHGLDLEQEFELDRFTIVVNSACLS